MKKYITTTLLFLCIQTIACYSINTIKLPFDLILLNEQKSTQNNEPINFNFVRIGDTRSKTFYIENTGINSYSIEKIQFLKNGLGVFSFSANPNPPTTIHPNKSIIVRLYFTPNKIGDFFDTLLIYFNEPFYFVYSIPVEGHSTSKNLIFVKDTSNFVGTANFRVPVLIKGDKNLVEPITINLTLLITTNARIFYIDSILNGKVVEKTRNQTFISYKVNFNPFVLDSSQQTLCTLIGKLFLASQDTTIITLSQTECDVKGIDFETKDGTVETFGICVSNMSLIDFNFDYLDVKLLNEVVSDELQIFLSNSGKNERIVNIELYNLLGTKIFAKTFNVNPEILVPLYNFPTGIYLLIISSENQKYSKLISVLK